MNSSISSFKPLIAAVVAILLLEAIVYGLVRPNFAERSNYLGYNYLMPEKFSKILIYEKLRVFGNSSPDIVQVGDSTGLHNIIPEIVERYLGSLKYVDMSCCAPTGFDGYYAIAKAVLDRDPNAKALVLYMSLNDLPEMGHDFSDQVGGATNLYDTFGAPWSFAWPPTMALRSKATAAVFSLGGLLRPNVSELDQNGNGLVARLWLDAHAGWWPELDPRFTPGNPKFILSHLCDTSDTYGLDLNPGVPNSRFYTHGIFGGARFLPTEVFERFAELAAAHRAKLVLAFQPHPCAQLYAPSLKILEASLSQVARAHPGVFVMPEPAFEHWPASEFVTQDHLRAGYEVADSERLGRFLARALGAPQRDVAADRDYAPDADAATPAVWKFDASAPPNYMTGLTMTPDPGTPAAVEVEPRVPSPRYYFETAVPDIEPGKPYIVSMEVKPNGVGAVALGLRDATLPGQLAQATCDFKAGSAHRSMNAFDNDIEALPDGWWRCWTSVLLCQRRAIIGVDLTDVLPGKRDGVLIRDFEVQPGWRLRPEVSPALPPIIPFGQRCS